MTDILKAIVIGGLFAVPFLTVYVENDYFFPFITGKNFWFRIIVDVVALAWVALMLADSQYRPKFSWLLGGFSALLVVMFFANLFGQHPSSSFWSNFERMDGYVTLVHTFLYFLVLGSVLTTKNLWHYFLHTSLIVAFFVGLYGLAQSAGMIESYRGNRIDSWLGNPAYLAIYLLFNIFIAFWLFVESRVNMYRLFYAFTALMFTYALFETGTRGTFIALIVGSLSMVGYIALFGSRLKEFRTYAFGAFGVIALVVGGLYAAQDTEFVQGNIALARIVNIDLGRDLEIRSIIWGMAWDGVQQRPLLGWGQSNYNYVFNEQYDPRLYAQEQWFDRAHNIVFDWLVAGGFLGFAAYMSIFLACAYYLFWRPLFNEDEESFTVLERGVLIGIIVGYFTHNFVVFDNIVSYIFFAVILALIHSRVAKPIPAVQNFSVDKALVSNIALPVVAGVAGLVIYFVHMPGMLAAADIIDAFREQDVRVQMDIFERALERDTFARQEITEQFAQRAMGVVRNPNVTPEDQQEYVNRAEQALLELEQFKPEDARIHVFMGSFYRSTNQLEKAQEQMARARALSPMKQAIIHQQGFVELSLGNIEAARDFYKEAFELDERYLVSREYYAASLFYLGDNDAAIALMDSEEAKAHFATSDFLVSAANNAGAQAFVAELFEERVTNAPLQAQNWATLAYLYYEAGNATSALETLERSKEALPEFTSTAECFADNIENGRDPQEGC